jgi:hypothetical protein
MKTCEGKTGWDWEERRKRETERKTELDSRDD